jgi:hypothetical protein
MRKCKLAMIASASLAATPALAQSPQHFSVTTSGFTAPDGQPWNARGLNVDLSDAMDNLQGILRNYSGTTMVRVVCNGDTDTLANIDPVVQAYTAKGIVVELEDHADSQGGGNTGWYTMLANAYKNNPLVFLETPNEPGASNTAQNQVAIIKAIRAAGFNNPIGIQPLGGWDESNLATVTAAVGTTNLYATPHIYGSPWQQAVIDGAKAVGLYSVIDEFGNAMDGFTIDPQGDATVQGVIAANKAGSAGAILWAAGNGYHPDGADSAFLDPTGLQLSSLGQEIQPWLAGGTAFALVNYTPNTAGPTIAQGQQAVDATVSMSVADVAKLAAQGLSASGDSVASVAASAFQAPPIQTSSMSAPGASLPNVQDVAKTAANSSDQAPPQPIVLQSDAPTGTMPVPAPSPGAVTINASGADQTLTEPAGNGTGTVSGRGNSITALGGIQMLDVTGVGNTILTGPYDDSVTVSSPGNVIDLGGGRNTITLDYKKAGTATTIAALSALQIDQDAPTIAPLAPAGNVFVAPQPGMGVLTIQGSPLAKGDVIDLTKSLAGVAGWDHLAADIRQFVAVGHGSTGTTISVGGRVVVALASGMNKGGIFNYIIAK